MTSNARELAQIPSTPSGRRNLIINGAMQVAQRSTSVTGIGASSGYFTVDRFKLGCSGTAGRLTMTQTADGHLVLLIVLNLTVQRLILLLRQTSLLAFNIDLKVKIYKDL